MVVLNAQCANATSRTESDLSIRAQALLTREIRFTYVSEFEALLSPQVVAEAEAVLLKLNLASARDVSSAQRPRRPVSSDIREWNTTDPLLTAEEELILFRSMNLMRYRVNHLRAKLSARVPSAAIIDSIDRMLHLADRIRTQIVNSNMRLVSSIARKFAANGVDVDIFSSDGSLVLMAAIDRYDYSRGFRFSTYATHAIQRHIFRTWRSRQRLKSRMSHVTPEFLAEQAESPPETPICSDPQAAVADLMQRAANILDPRELQIVSLRFGLSGNPEGATLRELAEDLGLSKERIRQLQVKALEKLRGLVTLDLILA